MSVHLVEIETLEALSDRRRPLAARVLAKTISIVVTLAHQIVQEVMDTIREDFRHGLIERSPKAWERD